MDATNDTDAPGELGPGDAAKGNRERPAEPVAISLAAGPAAYDALIGLERDLARAQDLLSAVEMEVRSVRHDLKSLADAVLADDNVAPESKARRLALDALRVQKATDADVRSRKRAAKAKPKPKRPAEAHSLAEIPIGDDESP